MTDGGSNNVAAFESFEDIQLDKALDHIDQVIDGILEDLWKETGRTGELVFETEDQPETVPSSVDDYDEDITLAELVKRMTTDNNNRSSTAIQTTSTDGNVLSNVERDFCNNLATTLADKIQPPKSNISTDSATNQLTHSIQHSSRISCSAHNLQLAIKDGLRVSSISVVLKKVTKFVAKAKMSTSCMDYLRSIKKGWCLLTDYLTLKCGLLKL